MQKETSLIERRLHKKYKKVKLALNVIDKIRQINEIIENRGKQLENIEKNTKELESKNHLILKTNGDFLFHTE